MKFIIAVVGVLLVFHAFDSSMVESKCIVKNIELKLNHSELCPLCPSALDTLKGLLLTNRTQFFQALVYICANVVKLDMQSCLNIVQLYTPSIIYVVSRVNLTSQDYCNSVLECSDSDVAQLNWDIQLINNTKPPIQEKSPPNPSATKLRVLQIADIHIDLKYQPGSISNCGEALCCRNTSTLSYKASSPTFAGTWGDYGTCDIPIWTVRNMFDYIARNEQFDYIYWTGDIVPHDIDDSRQRQSEEFNLLRDLFKEFFPNKTIYGSIGNHEAVPSNLFVIEGISGLNDSWLYTTFSQQWTQDYGLPSNLAANISRAGFYSVIVRPGLRLISLNMNFCYRFNFWLYANPIDPYGQLNWLMQTLQEAENKGEKVHIIGHIYPGGSTEKQACLTSFSKNYYKIVHRYENIIVGQMFGHSHNDFLTIFYDENKRPFNVAYISPSVTTYVNLNPGYRIYEIDAQTFEVVDHHTRYLDIVDANQNNNTIWKPEYSAKADYEMPSLFPQDWSNLVNVMLKNLNGDLANKYVKHFYKSNNNVTCDRQCKINLICITKQSISDNSFSCL